MHVNNLPKVVTQRCLEQDLNPRPTDRKVQRSTRCTTAPPVLYVIPVLYVMSYNSPVHIVLRLESLTADLRENTATWTWSGLMM